MFCLCGSLPSSWRSDLISIDSEFLFLCCFRWADFLKYKGCYLCLLCFQSFTVITIIFSILLADSLLLLCVLASPCDVRPFHFSLYCLLWGSNPFNFMLPMAWKIPEESLNGIFLVDFIVCLCVLSWHYIHI